MYKVIKHFIDLHDNDHSYNEGDIFPREGVDVSKERIEELAGSNNKQHGGMTAEVESTAEYAAYEEYGTRFMKGKPHIRPAFDEQKEKFKADMKELVR